MSPETIAVVGPTACGKTRRAVELAHAFDGEIISGDSRQVYRGMDIGTGKDLCEYGTIPYHLIDIADAGINTIFTVSERFQRGKNRYREPRANANIVRRDRMYVEAALSGLVMPKWSATKHCAVNYPTKVWTN